MEGAQRKCLKFPDIRNNIFYSIKRKRLIFTARILLFVLFMGLWEMSARCGWIDSFIFSSPSLIGKTFLSMCRDQSLFSHIGVTLTETLVSFFLL